MLELDATTKSQAEKLDVIRLGIHTQRMDAWIQTGVKILMAEAGMPLRNLPYPYSETSKVLFGEGDGTLTEADAEKAKTILLATSIPSEEILRHVTTGDLDLGIVAPEVMRASKETGFYAGELAFPGISRATTIRAALVSHNPVNPLVLEAGTPLAQLETPQDRFTHRLVELSNQCIARAAAVKASLPPKTPWTRRHFPTN